ncbi:MAG: XdhC family protein [Rhodanobacter sp.]|nr:XdhC family protein [Rhodanobacter sp.]
MNPHPHPPLTQAPDVPPPGGLRAIVEQTRALAERGRHGALALVVATRGSTYRKPGALILLDTDGVRVGALSGGCLEGELETQARRVIDTGLAMDAHFDTSGDEDRVFGSGTGCGGSIRLLLLPLPPQASPLRDALIDAHARGLALALRLVDTDAQRGAGVARVGEAAYAFDRSGAPASAADESTMDIRMAIAPAPRLLLLGAGPETRPVLCLTRMLGWRVELIERRERWARFAEGCGIDRMHRVGTDALPALLAQTAFDAALTMNHNVHLDALGLTHLAASAVPYIGLLGPARRRDDLLAEVGADIAAALQPRLRAPIGLPLGGEGAEAIALAIVAQLQEYFSRHAAR